MLLRCRQLNFYSFRKVLDEDDESGGYLVATKPNTFEYKYVAVTWAAKCSRPGGTDCVSNAQAQYRL